MPRSNAPSTCDDIIAIPCGDGCCAEGMACDDGLYRLDGASPLVCPDEGVMCEDGSCCPAGFDCELRDGAKLCISQPTPIETPEPATCPVDLVLVLVLSDSDDRLAGGCLPGDNLRVERSGQVRSCIMDAPSLAPCAAGQTAQVFDTSKRVPALSRRHPTLRRQLLRRR